MPRKQCKFWPMVGVGQSVMRLNLDCDGKLTHPTYSTLSLRKSHLPIKKLTRYL